jgi:inhibitor of KinA
MAVYSQPRFLLAGDRAIVVELGTEISPDINARVRSLSVSLEQQRIVGIVDLVPTYRSLLVYYDPMQVEVPELQDRILNISAVEGQSIPPPRVLHIPTHYGGEHGPDLDFVSRHTGLSPEEVGSIHAGTDYLVFMMGFNTGFPYLGGLSPKLAVPRLETPRLAVPAGSVAIAQQQTGIYPVESPGGWRLIGRSPLRLFDPRRDPPVAIDAGDYLRFVPIDGAQYREIEDQVQSGAYEFVISEKRG